MNRISFVVPAHNEEDNISRCIYNLLEYKRKEDEMETENNDALLSKDFWVQKSNELLY